METYIYIYVYIYTHDYSISTQKRRWIPVNGEYHNHDVIIIESKMKHLHKVFPSKVVTLREFVNKRSTFQEYLLRQTRLRDLFLTGKAIAVTDVSVAQLTQTAAVLWVFADDDTTEHATGVAGCSPLYMRIGSYGCELFGIYCILVSVDIVCEYYQIRKRQFRLVCDNDLSMDMDTTILPLIKTD